MKAQVFAGALVLLVVAFYVAFSDAGRLFGMRLLLLAGLPSSVNPQAFGCGSALSIW